MAENRGGRRVPDGVPRPSPIAFANGPNRSDLSALPGTPGTELPTGDPSVAHGQSGGVRRALANIPLSGANPVAGKGGLMRPSDAPNEPITAGLAEGEGPGPESILPNPDVMSQTLQSAEMRYAYPIIMRLATLPNATTVSKMMAQRLRASLPVAPEQIPLFPGE